MRLLFVVCVGALLFLSSCQRIPPTGEQESATPGPSSPSQGEAAVGPEVGGETPGAAGTQGEGAAEAQQPAPFTPQRVAQLDLRICRQALASVRMQIPEQGTGAGVDQGRLLNALDDLYQASVELVASLPSLQARQMVERALVALKDGRLEEARAAVAALQQLLPDLTLSQPMGEVERKAREVAEALAAQGASQAEQGLRDLASAVQVRGAEGAMVEAPLLVDAARSAVRMGATSVVDANVAQVEQRVDALAKEWGAGQPPAQQ